MRESHSEIKSFVEIGKLNRQNESVRMKKNRPGSAEISKSSKVFNAYQKFVNS